MDLQNQQRVKDAAEKFGAENVVVILGSSDAEGAEIDPDGDPWRPLVLHGKETRTIQGVAPNASATSFKLRVRQGERSKWVIH